MRLIEPESCMSMLEKGLMHIKKGEIDKALSTMDELIVEDPYFPQAYWARALCFEYNAETLDEANKAIIDYSKSIVYSDEPSTLSYGRRGILYFRTGRYARALEDLDKALETELYWFEARFYRGRTYIALGRSKDDYMCAVRDFTDMVTHIEQPFAPAYFWRAQALRALNENAKAVIDYKKAIEIDPDDVLSLNALAYCLEHGIGSGIDRKQAEKYYTRAAELGLIIAQKNLAWFYSGDDPASENASLSAYWMKAAALLGDAEAQNLYGLRRLHGKGVDPDPKRAVRYFTLAAEQEYPPAICNLAECYERGEGVFKNEEQAFDLYQKTSRNGYELGTYNVGRCYYFGIGTPENNELAFQILKPLADNGFAGAQDIIGLCYEYGYGTVKSSKLANRYFKKSLDLGNTNAAIHLGNNYKNGNGIKKNISKAAKLYTVACDKGSPFGWYALARLYFEEKHDYKKAEWAFTKAITCGKENITHWLAMCILRGKSPNERTHIAHALLEKSVSRESCKLESALELCSLEFWGAFGYIPDPVTAVERVKALVAAEECALSPFRSCAYAFLSKAYELGLGIDRDFKRAVELSRKARIAAALSSCSCSTAAYAHILIKGVGLEPNPKKARELICGEMLEHPENPHPDCALLYIWLKLKNGGGNNGNELIKLCSGILKEDPHNPMASYYSYVIRRNAPEAAKCLKKLHTALKSAPEYYRFIIERQLRSSSDEPAYPFVCAEDIDDYFSEI